MIVAGRKKLLLNLKTLEHFLFFKKGVACAYTEKNLCDRLILKFQSMSI